MGDDIVANKITAIKSKRATASVGGKSPVAAAKQVPAFVEGRRIALMPLAAEGADLDMLCGILHRLGCAVPNFSAPSALALDLDAASPLMEQKGTLLALLNDALSNRGLADDGENSSTMEANDRAKAALHASFDDLDLFVMKDAALPWGLPFWRNLLDAEELNAVAIHFVRKPISYLEDEGSDTPDLVRKLRSLSYDLEAERNGRGMRRYFITEEQLLSDAISFVEDSQDRLGLYWPSRSERVERDIVGKVLEWKRQAFASRLEAAEGLSTENWSKQLYEIFSLWAVKGEDVNDYEKLDSIYRELSNAFSVFSSLLKSNENLKRRVSMLSGCLNDADELYNKSTHNHEWQIDDLNKDVAKITAERDEWRSRARQSQSQAEGFEGALGELKNAHAELAEKNKLIEKDLQSVAAGKAQVTTDFAAMQVERDALRQELSQASMQLAQHEAALTKIQTEQTDRDVALVTAEEELNRLRTGLSDAAKNHEEGLRGLEEKIRCLALENSELTESVSAKDSAIAEWERNVGALNDRLWVSGEQLAVVNGELSAANAEISRIVQENERQGAELAHMLALVTQERDGLKQSKSEMETVIERQHELTSQLNRDLGASEARLTERDKELLALSHQLGETESALRQRQAEADQVGAELRLAMQSLDKSHQDIAKAKQSHSYALAKIEEYKRKIADFVKESDGQAKCRFQEIAVLTKLLSDGERALSDREQDLALSRADLMSSRNDVTDLAEKLRNATDDCQNMQADRDALVENMRILEGRFREMVGKMAETDGANQALQSENSDYQEQGRQLRALNDDLVRKLSSEQAKYSRAIDQVTVVQQDLAGQRRVADDLRQKMDADRDKIRGATDRAHQNFINAMSMLLEKTTGHIPKLSKKWSHKQRRQFIEQTAFFDPDWYVSNYQDVRDAGADPIDHFLNFGIFEGRAPNSAFFVGMLDDH
ncbi:hypothetical protein [Sphingobium yanoikuyae]|nr:hypothetical protein [Sphingobium yanoikuyae]